MLLELVFNQSDRQFCPIYRDIDFFQDKRQRADVVFVSVCNHNPAHLVLVFFEIGRIRDDKVNPRHIVVREGDPTVDNENVVPILEYRHVFANFVQATQRYNFQFLFSWHVIKPPFLIIFRPFMSKKCFLCLQIIHSIH